MATAAEAPARDFQFFADIVDAFKASGASSVSGDAKDMKVGPFLEAMTMFLRIFDAFGNPFFRDVVKKDVDGNIKKLRAAAGKHTVDTLEEVINEETKDPKMLKLIKNESGVGGETGTVALLWMKRMMQFVCGLLKAIVTDSAISLSSASRKSYSSTLRHCHNFITRGAFDTGLRFAPSRETFYKNLSGGEDVARVGTALAQFLTIFEPQLNGIVTMYKAKSLEPYIK